MNKQTNGFAIAISVINTFNMILMIFFSNVFGLPGLANGILGVIWFVVNAVFALILLVLIIVSCAYAFFSKDPESRYQPMRDDRSSFIRQAKESSTELDALAANVQGDMGSTKEWGMENRVREGAQSPEEQYGRFRPMSQHSFSPFADQRDGSFQSVNSGMTPPYGRSPPKPVTQQPRDYESYSNSYGMRSESPAPRTPGSAGNGANMWKRGAGFD
jgi:uncharacterized membrane protein